jgi:hypothetical protein
MDKLEDGLCHSRTIKSSQLILKRKKKLKTKSTRNMHFFERKNEFETLLSFFLIDAGMPPFSLNKFRDASKKKKKYLKLLSSTSVAIFKYNREYIKWIPSIQGGE